MIRTFSLTYLLLFSVLLRSNDAMAQESCEAEEAPLLQAACVAYQEGAACERAFKSSVDRRWCQVVKGQSNCASVFGGAALVACERSNFPEHHAKWVQASDSVDSIRAELTAPEASSSIPEKTATQEECYSNAQPCSKDGQNIPLGEAANSKAPRSTGKSSKIERPERHSKDLGKKCAKGDAEACVRIPDAYATAPEIGERHLRRACERKHASACLVLSDKFSIAKVGQKNRDVGIGLMAGGGGLLVVSGTLWTLVLTGTFDFFLWDWFAGFFGTVTGAGGAAMLVTGGIFFSRGLKKKNFAQKQIGVDITLLRPPTQTQLVARQSPTLSLTFAF